MTSKTKADPTAAEQYTAEQKTIRSLMATIETSLERHADQQKRDPKNWGYTGDLCHVVEQLNGAAKFLERAAPYQAAKGAR